MKNPITYNSSGEIEQVVRKFETCAYETHEFYHSRHLAVAAWYVHLFPPDLALEKMRSSLLRFTQHHGAKAYHETITRFWLLLVKDFLQTLPPNLPFYEQVNQLIQNFTDKNLVFDFYDRNLVLSERARQTWVEPNRRALE